MAERYTVDQVLEFLHNDFGDSEGEDSDFEGEGIYSYLPEVSNASELNSTSLLLHAQVLLQGRKALQIKMTTGSLVCKTLTQF